MLAAVHGFFTYCRITINPTEVERVRNLVPKIRGDKGQEKDEVPTPQQMGMLLKCMPIEARAFFGVAKADGARPHENINLTVQDMHWDSDPVMVTLSKTKEGKARTSFIDTEATYHLKFWLEMRRNVVAPGDYRLWAGYDLIHMNEEWDEARRLCRMAQRNEGLKQRRFWYRTYTTRKFFRTYGRGRPELNPPVLGIDADVLEALMGHTAYVQSTYARNTVGQIAAFYKRGEEALYCGTLDAPRPQSTTKTDDSKPQLTTKTVEQIENEERLAAVMKVQRQFMPS